MELKFGNKMRKPKSIIRERIKQILEEIKQGYGYQIAKEYNKRFSKVSQRVIYYHLEKGVLLNLFEKIEKTEKGEYSWGNQVVRIYYKNK